MKLEKAGANWKGKCPFHNEKTPSFFVSTDRNTYYCFGCGVKGDIFSFVQEFERVDFVGALKILAARAGVQIEQVDPKARSERDRLFAVLEAATNFFIGNLQKFPEGMSYLTGRGLKDETIKEWRLGFVADEWNSLGNFLKTKGFSDADMEKAGLVKKGNNGFYDRFRGRIVFPLFDSAGRVIGFSGRIFKDKEGEAKYLNSPETELFSKSHVLYGYHKAKNDIRVKDYSILVEGQMDLLISHQEGYHNTIATSGTALTTSHLEILKRLSNKAMVVYDSDAAGVNASIKAWQTALSIGMEIKIAQLPAGKDPAELIIEDKEKWVECLKGSKHIIDFYLDALVAQGLDERRLGLEVGAKILPYVRALDSRIEQSHYIGKIAHKAGIKEEALWAELGKIPLEVERKELVKEDMKPLSARLGIIERKLMSTMMWQEGVEGSVIAKQIEDKIKDVAGSELVEKLRKEFDGIKNELVFEAEVYYQRATKLENEVKELLQVFEEEYLKNVFSEKMAELSRAERNKDEGKIKELLEQCQDISKKLAILYNNHS